MYFETALSLEDWRRFVGWHPWRFWGMVDDGDLARTDSCDDVIRQYAWQSADRIGREDVLQAIHRAETKLSEQLGYDVGPRWREETVRWDRVIRNGWQRATRTDPLYEWVPFKVSRGFVRRLGVKTLTPIGSAVAVTLSDPDGDGYDELFTVSFATSETDPSVLGLFFVAADRAGDDTSLSERYRVRPVNVSIASGTATVTGPAWVLVRPVKNEGVGGPRLDLDPADVGVLATTLQPVKTATKTDGESLNDAQCLFQYETKEGCSCWESYSGINANDPGAVAQLVGRGGVRDPRLGLVYATEAVKDPLTGEWSRVCDRCTREPDRVLVRYYAGADLSTEWLHAIAALAAAELPGGLCSCLQSNRNLYKWQVDLAVSMDGMPRHQISSEDLNNPFGTKMGQVFAWRKVSQLSLGTAVTF